MHFLELHHKQIAIYVDEYTVRHHLMFRTGGFEDFASYTEQSLHERTFFVTLFSITNLDVDIHRGTVFCPSKLIPNYLKIFLEWNDV